MKGFKEYILEGSQNTGWSLLNTKSPEDIENHSGMLKDAKKIDKGLGNIKYTTRLDSGGPGAKDFRLIYDFENGKTLILYRNGYTVLDNKGEKKQIFKKDYKNLKEIL